MRERALFPSFAWTGTIEELKWITGLDGPCGITVHEDTLYVCEGFSQLTAIDIPSGTIQARFSAPEDMEFLNDAHSEFGRPRVCLQHLQAARPRRHLYHRGRTPGLLEIRIRPVPHQLHLHARRRDDCRFPPPMGSCTAWTCIRGACPRSCRWAPGSSTASASPEPAISWSHTWEGPIYLISSEGGNRADSRHQCRTVQCRGL